VRAVLAIAIVVLLAGCGTVTSEYEPSNVVDAPPPCGSGLIVFSTGAPSRCVHLATYLELRPEGGSGREKPLARAGVDSYIVKSDFEDHQGNLHVMPVPAGRYYLATWTDNPLVRQVTQPKAVFSVEAGESVYLGEFYMRQGCGFEQRYEVNDQITRDLALLKSKASRIDPSKITKRLMELSGGLPACDATNNALSCR